MSDITDQLIKETLDSIDYRYDMAEDRLKHNRELVQLLNALVEQNPYLRFGQILADFHFVKEHYYDGGDDEMSILYWTNEFMTESKVIRERVEQKIDWLKRALAGEEPGG